jgi:hypothetical protein
MMEIKVHCLCGQKFKFDVEPVNGAMPFPVMMFMLLISLVVGIIVSYRIAGS